MTVERPAFLVLLALVPLAVYLAVWSRSRIGRGRRFVSLAIRVVALLAITAGLAGVAVGSSAKLTTVFLMDTSDSILLVQQGGQAEWIYSALEDASPDTRVAAVQFSGRPRVAALPDKAGRSPETFMTLDPDMPGNETNYEKAFAAGLSLIGPDANGRLILLSDGKPNVGDLDAAVAQLRAREIPVYVRPIADLGHADVALESASAPPRVRQGQSFDVQVVAVSRRRTEARLRLWAGNDLVADNRVELAIGSNPFSVRVPARGIGIQIMRVELLDDADRELGNNVLETFTQVLAPPRVLIVGEQTATVEAASILREVGLAVSTGSAASLPDDYQGLASYETVFLVNVPASSISAAQQVSLRDHVAVGGRGLIVTGGDESFGAGEYSNQVIDEILPVRSNPPEEEQKGLALILAIDRSTSMVYENNGVSKFDMAKEAAVQAVGLLEEGDRIGVIAFDSDSTWIAPPRAVSSANDLRALISRIRSMEIGGGTDIYTAIQTARQRLRSMDAGLKHLILITDGQATYGDFDLFGRQVRRDGISVSTIGVGADADLELLEKLARDGEGRNYFAADPSSIPAVLTKETELAQSFFIVNRRHQPRLLSPSPIFQGASSDATLPFLGGFVRTKAKATAEVVLASDSNDPILATWQFGLGRAVAWTSDLGGPWSEEWSSWAEYPEVLAGMVFWASAGAAGPDSGLSVSTVHEGDRVLLVVDSTDVNGEFRNLLPTSAVISPPSGPRIDLDLKQTGPGRYEGTFRSSRPGIYRIVAIQETPDTTFGPELAAVAIPYSAEMRLRDSGASVLRYIAKTTGGGLLDDPSDAIPRFPLGRPETLTPILITAGMLLFLTDVGVRRVRTGRREMREQYDDVLQWLEDHRPAKLIGSAMDTLRRHLSFLR